MRYHGPGVFDLASIAVAVVATASAMEAVSSPASEWAAGRGVSAIDVDLESVLDRVLPDP